MTDRTPTVSVAMATRNGERFVQEQLLSIMSQSHPVAEIVVSDDGSTDATLDRVREVAADHPNVRFRILSHAVAAGVTANFERAICACASDLIALSDQDDRWHEDRVATSVAVFSDRPELLALHADAALVDVSGRMIGSLFRAIGVGRTELEAIHRGLGFEELLRRNLATGATMMFRRKLIRLAEPFPDSWLHDEWLAAMAAARDGLDVMEQAIIDYRQHGGNAIGASTRGLRARISRLTTPGQERNARLLARATVLAERMRADPGVPLERVWASEAKLQHERLRSGLARQRLRRILPIVREWRSGGYSRFGNGAQDVLRDLVQPLAR